MKFLDERVYREHVQNVSLGTWTYVNRNDSVRSRDEIVSGSRIVAFGTIEPGNGLMLAAAKDLYLALLKLHSDCIRLNQHRNLDAEKALQKASGIFK